MNSCIYQYSLDSDDAPNQDLLAPPNRFIEFEIAHGDHHPQYEEHEIIRVRSSPDDCDRGELRDAIEDYYQLYFTGETFITQQAIQRLMK